LSAIEPPPTDCVVVTVKIPHALPLQPVPLSDQFKTALGLLFAAGVKVATRPAVTPGCTLAGAVNCRRKLLVILMLLLLCLEESAALVAVTMTLAGLGNICGAV